LSFCRSEAFAEPLPDESAEHVAGIRSDFGAGPWFDTFWVTGIDGHGWLLSDVLGPGGKSWIWVQRLTVEV
jgi:hypothetical protein